MVNQLPVEGGRLFAFDQDQVVAQVAGQLQSKYFTFVKANTLFMQQFLTFPGIH